MSQLHGYNYKKEQGLSLVELMVALLISSILLLGVATIYSASKRSQIINEEFAVLQESARYAMHRLSKEIRMTGYTGCKDIENTAFNMISGNPPDVLVNFNVNRFITGHRYEAGSWSDDFDMSPPTTAGATGRLVTDADAVTIRKASACSTPITTRAANAGADLIITDNNCNFVQNEMLIITDCATTDIFTKTNAASDTAIAHATTDGKNTQTDLTINFDTDAYVMRAEAITFYIGTDNTTDTNRHLYMQTLAVDASGDYTTTVRQFIPNVENMVLQYGLDTDGDDSIDEIRTADDVNPNWDDVISVYLRLLLYTDNIGSGSKPYTFNGITYDGGDNALPDDQRFRREFVTAINLRNRIR